MAAPDYATLHIPAALRAMPRWAVWKYGTERASGKCPKVPHDARTRKKARVSHPDDWCDYETALRAYEGGGYAGLGFVFVAGDGLIGLDLDECVRADNGGLSADAARLLAEVATYAEVSPSGTGVKAFAFGTIDPTGPKRRGNVEVYGAGRFFTVTGDHVPGTPLEVANAEAALRTLQASLATKPVETPKRTGTGLDATDATLLRRALCAKNGAKLHAYYDRGELQDKPTHSEALLSMATMFAFWTGDNSAQLERLVCGSRLWRNAESEREKWNEDRGGLTWGMRHVILKAIELCDAFYGPEAVTPGAMVHTCVYVVGNSMNERILSEIRGSGVPPFIVAALKSRQPALIREQRELAALCLRLGERNDGKFYLSSLDAGRLLGIDQTTVSRWLRKFAKMKLIERTARGNGVGLLAHDYRWIGPVG